MEHDRRSRELEAEAEDMQARGDHLDATIAEVRQDWQRKQADGAVPGAEPHGDGPGTPQGHDGDVTGLTGTTGGPPPAGQGAT